MSMEHTRKKRFIDKEIYQKLYGSDVPSEAYPLPVLHLETVFMIKMLQLLYYKFFMITIAGKPWQIMLHGKPLRQSKI